MGKLLVTGATGHLGRLTLQALLTQVPPHRLAGLARDPSRATDLAEQGVDIRKGDYFDHDSLVEAFDGVDRLLLVSAEALTDRDTQHANVITAAKQAGAQHVIFTAVQRREDSDARQIGVTDGDIFAENVLKNSGLTYTILRHPTFMEHLGVYIGADAYDKGVRVPEGDGTVAPATRHDLAAANVAVLTQDGHENTTYTLSGSEAASFRDIANALTEIHGSEVLYLPITAEEYTESQLAQGLPREVAEFLTSWATAITGGTFSENTGDLERLIGYRPTSYREFLAQNHPRLTQTETLDATKDLLEGEYVPSPDPMTREQVELYERTDGREGATMMGGPVVVVTMRGARSGKLRKVALMRIERDGVYAIGASAGGQARHPNWFHNLVAHPIVQLQDGPDRRLMTARVAEGPERESWLAYADGLYPFFADMRARAANDREVPLVLLEPAEG
ncbi:deazaflavin-dependent oxidoreductase, nitroreductase family [Lentzea waywayandensis]|uniref:Deazaflavin-dependent oxidoreductase, nitroreductase family n=1 Tax=Lentzea waywayandensis TaxID=84724 RepID=A0A1I6CTA7_9PSEU|nr:nitroreductase/quinone reductase family protein [Lentzea waywayandensis]SFQ96484.1 deazaflavin-dependent oxidoreductase, nitroreductase family [Lentzea waywayandensis]